MRISMAVYPRARRKRPWPKANGLLGLALGMDRYLGKMHGIMEPLKEREGFLIAGESLSS
jgi:hypothetical protein